MVRFVIINGLGGCGKSTFIQLCEEYCDNPNNLKAFNWMVTELSTVDFVKEIARNCGWDGKKEKKDREFLHDLKVAMEKWDNIPNKKVLEDAENFIKSGSFFNLDYVYSYLSNSSGEDPLDFDAMKNNKSEFIVVATDAESGNPVYFNKKYLSPKDKYYH